MMSERGDHSTRSDKSLSKETSEKIIDVQHFILFKRVAETVDKELSLVATFIQRVWHDIDEELNSIDTGSILEESDIKKLEILEKKAFFDYRINDIGADDNNGWIKTRRVEMNAGERKKTMEANLPLRIEDYYECFPFKIVTASVTVELSSSCKFDQRRRPNLLLHRDRKSENVSIQEILPFDIKLKEKEIKASKDAIEALVKKKLDDSISYDFVTPFPEVSYLYDIDKNYCPKLKVTFYMVESGMSKFVNTVSPMLLIAILNTIQVFDTLEGEIETVNFLGNAASFALTAVFVLPSIISESKGSVVLNKNNIYIMLIFIGLALSSLPDRLLGTNIPAFCGMAILWLSFVFPIWGFFEYFTRIHKIKKRSPKKVDRLVKLPDIPDYVRKSTFKYKGAHNLLEHDAATGSDSVKLSCNEKKDMKRPGKEEYDTVLSIYKKRNGTAKYKIDQTRKFLLLQA